MAEKFFPGLTVLVVSSVMSGPLFAAQQARQTQQAQQTEQGENEISPFDPGLMLTSAALIGSQVVDPDGASVAEVEQLMIDPDTGRVEFVMLSIPGNGNRLVAVPWNYLRREDGARMMLVASREQLAQAPRMEIDPGGQSSPAEPNAGGSQAVGASGDNRISYAPSPAGRQGYTRGENVSMTGTVVGTMTAPLQGDTDHRVAYVDVGQAEEVRLHLGPDWYLKELGVNLEPDDLISFSGSRVPEEEETIVLVDELRLDGHTFVLRDPEGMGVWQRPGSR